MSLYDDIIAVSPPRETKADIVDYYRSHYPRNWQSELVKDLHPFTSVKNVHNLARRFNAGTKGGENRLARPGGRVEQQEYRALGSDLPPRAPEGGYHIYGLIYVKMSDGECEEREVDEYISYEQGKRMLDMAIDEMLQAVVNHYMTDGSIEDDEPIARVGDCQEPDLQVEAIE